MFVFWYNVSKEKLKIKNYNTMKTKIGYSLLVLGIADAIYMYINGLLQKLDIFSPQFFLLIAIFMLVNFAAILVLGLEPQKESR